MSAALLAGEVADVVATAAGSAGGEDGGGEEREAAEDEGGEGKMHCRWWGVGMWVSGMNGWSRCWSWVDG